MRVDQVSRSTGRYMRVCAPDFCSLLFPVLTTTTHRSRFIERGPAPAAEDSIPMEISDPKQNSHAALRRKAEEALRESETKYRIVAENTYDWEFWLSPAGEFLYMSPACRRITGHHVEAFIKDPGLLSRIIVHPDDRARFEHHMHEVREHRAPAQIEFCITHTDGTWRWISHVCQPVFDADGRFLGTRGSSRDITQRKELEDELRRSHDELELRVRERTAELARMNEELGAEIAERKET